MEPVEGSCYGQAGEVEGSFQVEDGFYVVEIDLAEISFGLGDGAADQAAG